MSIPDSDVVAATVETQSANLTPIGRSHIGDDASDHNVLNGFAVRT